MNRTLLAAALLLGLAGCNRVYFLQPLYSAGELVQEPALAGVWADSSGNRVVLRAEGDHYRYEEGDTRAQVCLVRLAGILYADAVEEGPGIPHHRFFRVRIDGQKLQVAALSEDWVIQQLEMRRLPFELVEGGGRFYVVTASQRQLQWFLICSPGDAWEEPDELQRVQEPEW